MRSSTARPESLWCKCLSTCVALVFCLVMCALILVLMFGVVPRNLGGWAALILIGLPTAFALEWLGTRVLGWADDWPPVARVIYGVFALLALVVVGAPPLMWMYSLM